MNKHFVAGFIAGEGSFGMYRNNKSLDSYYPKFTVEVHIRDIEILKEIKILLKCGNINIFNGRPNIVRFSVTSFSDSKKYIIPFMDRYLKHTYKKCQYLEWRSNIIGYNQKRIDTIKKLK